jgi:catechol 2,3-dioxygenase-like lactoylglutathione lyase family enzyme
VRGADSESRVLGPARVERIAHTAYMSQDLPEIIAWYQDTLGVIPTDELVVGDPDNVLGQFNRVDLGDTPVDHHVIFLLRGRKTGMHHVSFQVEGVDDIFFGYDHMLRAGRDHVRGIGRHALGSQIFNYWMSPDRQMHEHWISHERMNASSRFNRIRIGEGMSYDTGEAPPKRFVEQATPIVAMRPSDAPAPTT